jgi:hypothetical protein
MDPALELDARQAHAEVKAGGLRGEALAQRLSAVPWRERDAWVDVLLGLPEAPADVPLPPGAVPYLPAGVDEILALVREAPLGGRDLLVDLGSGLGRVVLLAHLLSGARAHGVELQAPLVEAAEGCRRGLGLAGVSFEQADAGQAALAGSVFFLYSPFGAPTLHRVLARLEARAQSQPLVICTVGLELPAAKWLRPRAAKQASMAFYDCRA